jgi:Trypsin-co-occurring domain 2
MAAKSAIAAMPLADAIQELRAEITSAIERGKNEEFKFKLGTIELELTMVVTKEGDAGGKFSFKVLGIGAEASLGAKLSGAATHKVKVVLNPPVVDMPIAAEK